jgi:hypothetical protein
MTSDIKTLLLSGDKQIFILSAGMQRSGSTWLYNATRLLLIHSPLTGDKTGYGWIGDLSTLPQKRIMLMKIHWFSQKILDLDLPKIILYSYRDLRDALASIKRIWNHEPSMELAERLIQNDRQWRSHADFIMRYESMMTDQQSTLQELSNVLKINTDVNIQKIIAQIDTLKYEDPGNKKPLYHMENLLHKGHFTSGRHGSWKGFINNKLLKQIESKYREWFIQNNYPL